jgi:hypothetical protein
MKLEYVPLLQIQRDLHDLPRNYARFQHYLRTIFQDDELGMRAPLLAMNPMGKEHVAALLDQYLALDADAVAAQAVGTAAAELADVPGTFKAALVMADDLMGGWTNRYANEFEYRFGWDRRAPAMTANPTLPRWLNHFWIFGLLWTSEPARPQHAREAILTAVHRLAYTHEHGPARNLRDMLVQEGHIMLKAGCTAPALDAEDVEYARQVLVPFLDATDNRTCMECLFGDEPGRTLGFTPRGLSPWAGLALALHDARLSLAIQPAC